ncbi:MAG: peptide-methionine (R)-S-oxide reductase MsrB [candidate division KSB1 bacterium]|nr:peptide-methionine (R)-S-oxide reductase MsrB [candidate division KSB1 bacterium]MDZ7275422.1 peptide-methionine (R)-S-oxide reductase MsrB [candidate division KSB1 bacterium]MDZ7286266.1 peptide-methionine (R)-S-oxide reductase MsrB [candidate division KSB1 bacterium]MDZ7296492.1 peptide-methionine (R)-S-oxide reductase MsrB [candidate division KSB1 bacterium]MDZ7305550.1 peptide-methionine (R)-S-oxide reductase MsrB [candidate division KSB1 bacterium]
MFGSRLMFLVAAVIFTACMAKGGKSAGNEHAAVGDSSRTFKPLQKTREQWRQLLSPEAYGVLFEENTEPPFTSPLNREKRRGTFICAACYLPLFSSEAKFESGTGWPSFFKPIAPAHIATKTDYKLMLPRTEYHCARCGGHQGHVFDDGPPPTGQRWCNNGVALKFIPEGEPLPALRD